MEAVQDAEKKVNENMVAVQEYTGKEIAITDQATLDTATDIMKEAKKRIKTLNQEYKDIVKPLDESRKKIAALFKKPIEAYQNYYDGLKRKSGDFITEQERIQADEQAKRDEVARKEQARLNKKADKQDEKGDAVGAETSRHMSNNITPPVVGPKAERRGIYTVIKYTVSINDPTALLKWILENNKIEYINFDQSLFNKEATSTKGQRTWPGTRNEKHTDVRHRG